jgi:plastocyanin
MRYLLVLAVAWLAIPAAIPGGTAVAAQQNIGVANFYFCDQSFQNGVCETTVNVGDTVVWQVQSGTHTVTECDDSFATCPPAGGFNSGTLSTGASFSHTFTTAGVFEYRCNIHPNSMRGRVTVVAQSTPTPTPATAATPSPAPTAIPSGSGTPAAVPASGGPPASQRGLEDGVAVVLAAGLLLLAGALIVGPVIGRRRA